MLQVVIAIKIEHIEMAVEVMSTLRSEKAEHYSVSFPRNTAPSTFPRKGFDA